MRTVILALALLGVLAAAFFFRDSLPIAGMLNNATAQRPGTAAPQASAAWGAKDLKLCNDTPSRIGVAIGYKDAREGWTSEGWWNVSSKSCDVLIQDKLRARFYYIYAIDYDRGGEWSGSIQMCTDDSEFTIRGLENCQGRGYKKTGFFEVDTQEQTGWTVKLTEQGDAASASNGPIATSR